MELEHKTDVAVAEVTQLFLRETGYVDRINVHRTAVGTVKGTDNLEQGSLTCTTGTNNADYFAFLYAEVDTFSYFQ